MISQPDRGQFVSSTDGVKLYVAEWGSADAPPIILVHGWSQAHQCWARQADSPLANEFRIVAPDLRGHGMSDKPLADSFYTESQLWADDLAAIIERLGLVRPLLVGWSMGGWIVQDYLSHYGDANVSGVVLVGTSVTTGQFLPEAARTKRASDSDVTAKDMLADDLTRNITATKAFLSACFHAPLEAEAMAFMLGFNMVCPPEIRAAARGRNMDYRTVMAGLDVPVALAWGTHERLALPEMIEQARDTLPDATCFQYTASGHAPFWEEAATFNEDLSRFARSCFDLGARTTEGIV